MASFFVRLPIRRFIAFLGCAVVIYLMIGNSLMPARLKANTARDILSVEQQQQVAPQQHGEQAVQVHSAGAQPIAGAEHAQISEDAFEELVQSHQESEKERLRSPDVDMGKNNGSRKDSGRRQMEEKPLLTELSRMEHLEAERALAASQQNKSLCPDISDNKGLLGKLPQATLLITNMKEAEVRNHYPYLEPGGRWRPTECVARYKVALIIPFRDRQTHLTRLIDFLVPILKRQLLDFRFIVTEQYGRDLFNKGRIMNAAFRIAERLGVDCVIFHDVDMFPQDDHNSYGCPPTPRHIGAFVSNLGYQLWYKEIVGGVLAITMDDYRAINGYSNMYWAWGGEDDDMGKRILSQNMTIERPDPTTGRFSMLKHVKRKRTAPKLIYKLLDSADTRWQTDGLNVTSWKIVKFSVRPLYYHIYVDVGTPPPEWRANS
ncbi:Beta-1,4-N-acetylgalactosaminyltransferase bre-4 [Toxocara canis]|uniref:Beta-1,4-N-acetylgalactosaminyltransferase n=1 Tax=Toxocara canis TaxID=6265 RepID=A0A0B2V242_TOXCA|nr:Beta-1,4-N-acetylgalactosaminyltransferase bre-4 [Toxocara canis]